MLIFIIKTIANLSRINRSIISSFITAVTFYFGAYLSTAISELFTLGKNYDVAIYSTIFIVLLSATIFISQLVTKQLDFFEHEKEEQKTTIYRAYALCDTILINRSSELEANKDIEKRLLNLLGTSTKNIQGLVDAAYRTFESTYGKSSSSEERIDFEVTFMTKSFKDQNITIPAGANKDGRQPRSMILRDTKPEIYSNTVTAWVYKMDSPSVIIISDTSSKETQYHELYPHQTDRIKSSIVYPVLSNQNRLLGTVVVHCDQVGFFRTEKKKYWSDLLEVFAKKIAYEVIMIEAMFCMSKENSILEFKATYEVPY